MAQQQNLKQDAQNFVQQTLKAVGASPSKNAISKAAAKVVASFNRVEGFGAKVQQPRKGANR